MPLRSQGYCGFGRGLSGLLWVWCNGSGPHLELRQEPQGSAPDFLEAGSDSDRRVPVEFAQECQVSCSAEEWNSAYISWLAGGFFPTEPCGKPQVEGESETPVKGGTRTQAGLYTGAMKGLGGHKDFDL